MGFSKEQISRIKESIKVGSFCKSWWKQLTKLLNDTHLSKSEKINVYMKLVEGLLDESIKIVGSVDDIIYISNTFVELQKNIDYEMYADYGMTRIKEDD